MFRLVFIGCGYTYAHAQSVCHVYAIARTQEDLLLCDFSVTSLFLSSLSYRASLEPWLRDLQKLPPWGSHTIMLR